ncbi:hypothetical protein HYH03_001767 [Edaphochlamys debaryana]|uniref:SRCR domain-containing protein n=1 Tax=Edaphochlamys debaryana TaxID=47281 RepID=A0A836C5Y8_9CHLO|nr:hypothetical protein HYH03_001767 [Edaphochlamys debaryana]|eukprot:KAG2500187.1 hypothetical protein HYH03_001767 [Edaphochlamys debaryana]
MRRASFSSCAGAIAVLLLLATANAQGKKKAASPYQISLVLGTTGINTMTGRVMVVPAECVFFTFGQNGPPIPMCDDDFTDAKADTICKNVGYKFGRKFYSPAVTFPSGDPPSYVAYGLSCGAATGRRLRAGGEDAARRRDLLGLDPFGEYEYTGPNIGSDPQPGIIATTTATATRCTIQVTKRCPSPFYYAGVECSDVPFKAAPPPMALPPSPPPPPPTKSDFIRAYVPEANLGTFNPETNRPFYSRFDLSTTQGWVPLCGFDTGASADFTTAFARHVCNMFLDYPAISVESVVRVEGFQIVPIGAPVPGGFDPATRTFWARVTPSSSYNMARLIQDTPAPAFQISTTPCTTLFVAYCSST